MKLMIVESPTKAKKIGQALGSDFVVKASFGHIADLPVRDIGVDLTTMNETYVILPKKGNNDPKQKVAELKKLASEADEIFLASDPDREGEAISWHLKKFLGIKTYKRIEIKEITEKGVREAMKNARQINDDWVEAQRARRVIDRLLGYGISPALARSIKGAKSAGRVQSAALHLMVERERAIQIFKPEDRFSIEATFTQSKIPMIATLQQTDESMRLAKPTSEDPNAENTKFSSGKKLVSSTDLTVLLKDIQSMGPGSWAVNDVEEKPSYVNPQAPLITSTLMMGAASRFGWTSEHTMKVAQALFENGHITYHRTDSVRVEADAQAEALVYISKNYGAEYAPSKPNVYKTKDAAQDAHECIRPSHVEKAAIVLETEHAKLATDANKLYEFVRNSFLASQSVPGENTLTKVTIKDQALKYSFLSETSVVKFDGFRKFKTFATDDDLEKISGINKGACNMDKVEQKATRTKPPARYKEETLVKELEKQGIGRPSSWANVTKTLLDRTYIEKDSKRAYTVTQLGFGADDWLTSKAPQYTDAKYTSKMENDLDDIEAGKKLRVPVLELVRDDLQKIFGPLGQYGSGGVVTDKMKAILDTLKANGENIPAEAWEDNAICKPILDAFFANRKPSEKQVELAKKLSQQLFDAGEFKLQYTDEMVDSNEETKKYIDKAIKLIKKNPEMMPDKAASEKQVSYARKLAEKAGKTFDEELVNSFRGCSAFIEEMLGGKSSGKPSPAKKTAAKKPSAAKKTSGKSKSTFAKSGPGM